MVVAPERRTENVPRHVAVIMDANGRWAETRGLSRMEGHAAGTENIREIIRLFGERGVRVLTLYAFSTENWRRPPDEVRGLMHILSRVIERELEPLHEAGVQLRYIGQLDVLEPVLRRQIRHAVARTAANTEMTVCVAFNYGGRSEVVDAIRQMSKAAYAEYFFTPTYWPDFSQADVDEALEAYAQRVRKFGGLAARQAQSADAPGAQHG